MQPDQVTGVRSPLVAIGALLVALGLAKGAARLVGFGVLLAVVAATVGALTVGVAVLRLLVLR